VECDGEREANHDGWPATICRAYHLDNGSYALVLCEFCAPFNLDKYWKRPSKITAE
jgi:hypothetical protein